MKLQQGLFTIIIALPAQLITYETTAQVFTNDAGAREKHFIYEVKQIDEFFERFNNDTASFLRKTYKAYHTKYNIDRAKLLKSLFNYETKSWDQALIDNFVKEVTVAEAPSLLNFQADGWYAEANCKFQYKGATINIPVVLRIVTDSRKRSRWMIAAAKTNVLKGDESSVRSMASEKPRFINPASHANNFIELDKALNDKENLADYFDTDFFKGSGGAMFYNAVLSDSLKYLYVKDITYHFLQLTKWVFTVNYFPRETLNAGWLINSLRKVSENEKQAYLKNLLDR